jgi:hypothetical protein
LSRSISKPEILKSIRVKLRLAIASKLTTQMLKFGLFALVLAMPINSATQLKNCIIIGLDVSVIHLETIALSINIKHLCMKKLARI